MGRWMKKNCGGEDGFTLLELIMVVSLIALILSFSGFFIAGETTGSKLNAAGREISASLRYARSLAMSRGEPQAVHFDLGRSSFGIDGRFSKGLPAGVGMRVIDPVKGDVRDGQYSIAASPSGRLDAATLVLWKERRTITIRVSPVTGPVMEQTI